MNEGRALTEYNVYVYDTVSLSVVEFNHLYPIHRGSYMSAHVLLNLLKELGKRDKMRGLSSVLSLFLNEFNKFNNTRARILDSIKISLKSYFCLSILLHDVISLPGATSYRVSCMINIDTISMKLTIVHFKGSQVEFSKL